MKQNSMLIALELFCQLSERKGGRQSPPVAMENFQSLKCQGWGVPFLSGQLQCLAFLKVIFLRNDGKCTHTRLRHARRRLPGRHWAELRGDLPWRARRASRWQSWPYSPSETTWSWEAAAPNAARPGFPFLSGTPDVEDAALCQVTAFQVKWDRAGILCAQGPGGRRPRKHTACNVNRPDFSDSKVHFGTRVRAFEGKWNRSRVYLFLHSY